mgnify:CR=1 FL=1
MAKLILRDGTELSDYGKPYFVAEVNSSTMEMWQLQEDD